MQRDDDYDHGYERSRGNFPRQDDNYHPSQSNGGYDQPVSKRSANKNVTHKYECFEETPKKYQPGTHGFVYGNSDSEDEDRNRYNDNVVVEKPKQKSSKRQRGGRNDSFESSDFSEENTYFRPQNQQYPYGDELDTRPRARGGKETIGTKQVENFQTHQNRDSKKLKSTSKSIKNNRHVQQPSNSRQNPTASGFDYQEDRQDYRQYESYEHKHQDRNWDEPKGSHVKGRKEREYREHQGQDGYKPQNRSSQNKEDLNSDYYYQKKEDKKGKGRDNYYEGDDFVDRNNGQRYASQDEDTSYHNGRGRHNHKMHDDRNRAYEYNEYEEEDYYSKKKSGGKFRDGYNDQERNVHSKSKVKNAHLQNKGHLLGQLDSYYVPADQKPSSSRNMKSDRGNHRGKERYENHPREDSGEKHQRIRDVFEKKYYREKDDDDSTAVKNKGGDRGFENNNQTKSKPSNNDRDHHSNNKYSERYNDDTRKRRPQYNDRDDRGMQSYDQDYVRKQDSDFEYQKNKKARRNEKSNKHESNPRQKSSGQNKNAKWPKHKLSPSPYAKKSKNEYLSSDKNRNSSKRNPSLLDQLSKPADQLPIAPPEKPKDLNAFGLAAEQWKAPTFSNNMQKTLNAADSFQTNDRFNTAQNVIAAPFVPPPAAKANPTAPLYDYDYENMVSESLSESEDEEQSPSPLKPKNGFPATSGRGGQLPNYAPHPMQFKKPMPEPGQPILQNPISMGMPNVNANTNYQYSQYAGAPHPSNNAGIFSAPNTNFYPHGNNLLQQQPPAYGQNQKPPFVNAPSNCLAPQQLFRKQP